MLDEHIHAEQLRADGDQQRKHSLSQHSSNLSSTTTHSHSVGTLRGGHAANVNGSGGGIISHIFSSGKSQVCRASQKERYDSIDESLVNHAPGL